MEKGTPHHKLSVVKALIAAGSIRMTASAVADGERLGFSRIAIVAIVTTEFGKMSIIRARPQGKCI